MPNRCYQCPSCGRCRNCGRPLEGATPLQAAGECCNRRDNLARELYAGRAAREETCVACYDPLDGCQEYPRRDRSSFWPGFCHPRWLPCRELYRR